MTTIRVKENEPFDVALRRFKRTIEKLGLLTELRAREFYEKPTSERKRKHAAAVKRRYKRNPDQFAATAYAYTYVVAQAARNGRAATPEVMQAQLAAITGAKSVKTLLGTFSFDVNRNGVSPVLVQQVKRGKWKKFNAG